MSRMTDNLYGHLKWNTITFLAFFTIFFPDKKQMSIEISAKDIALFFFFLIVIVKLYVLCKLGSIQL